MPKRMKLLSLNCIVLVSALFAAALSGCASLSNNYEKPRYQSFEIGSDGKGVIRNFHISYGEMRIPHGSNFDEITPASGVVGSESHVVPIPELSYVTWYSADGKSHATTIPIRKLIKDLNTFYGFKFIFVDDRLDVYLQTNNAKPGKFPIIISELVFSSKSD